METLKTIFTRQSTRSFAAGQISETALETILKAACAAPVGMAKFEEIAPDGRAERRSVG
jgi:FMN reductase (NADPH)